MDSKTVSKRVLYEGFEALQKLAKLRDKDGRPLPVKVAHPVGRNLRALRDDYETILELDKDRVTDQAKQANEFAVKDREGNPVRGTQGPILKDPVGFREKTKTKEQEWKVLLATPVEIRVLTIKVSELDKAMGDGGLRIDADDLDALIELGVLSYDLDAASAEKK